MEATIPSARKILESLKDADGGFPVEFAYVFEHTRTSFHTTHADLLAMIGGNQEGPLMFVDKSCFGTTLDSPVAYVGTGFTKTTEKATIHCVIQTIAAPDDWQSWVR